MLRNLRFKARCYEKNIAPLCSCVLAIEPREIQVASISIILEFRVTHAICLFLRAKIYTV